MQILFSHGLEMYCDFERIELQKQTLELASSGQNACHVTQLIADGLRLMNAVERIEYQHTGFQALICEQCGIAGCEPGSWVCLRVVGQRVLLIPAVERLREDSDLAHEFAPPHYLTRHKIPTLRTDQYASLGTVESELPPLHDLKDLTALEALAVHQVTAPGGILGPIEEGAQINSDVIIAVTDADLGPELQHLHSIVEQAEAGELVKVFEAPDRIVEFHLDLPGYPSWHCLAFKDGEPGFFVGAAPSSD